MTDQEGAPRTSAGASDFGGVRRGTLMGLVSDGVCRLDGAGRIVAVNDELTGELGYPREELLGEPLSTVVADADRDRLSAALDGELDGGESLANVRFETADGARLVCDLSVGADDETTVGEFVAVLRTGDAHRTERDDDVRSDSEPKVADWRSFGTLLDAIDEYAIAMLDPSGRIVSWNGGAERITGYDRDDVLAEHVAVVYPPRARNEGEPERHLADAADGGTVRDEGWLVRADGTRFWADITVTAVGNDDGSLRGYATVVRDATERKHAEDDRERELERQRQQLTALNNLNGVVRRINGALVRQSTREEIERLVCEQLHDSDSYAFAWVGEADLHEQRIRVTTEAGAASYLDDAEIALDGAAGRGPTGKAVETEEMQVVRDVRMDPDYEPWRDLADEYGFRSTAAIPIAHDNTLYGVLNVYTARPNAFGGEEREVIGQLGETVGHAIAAVERKRALMNDEMVEIEFRLRDVFGEFDVPTGDGQIRFERVVPLGDDSYVEYGVATADMVETLEALPGTVPGWEEVSVVDDSFDETRFEATLSEPPLSAAVASRGCRIKESVVEDGDQYLLVQLPQGAQVRQVVESVKEESSSVEFVSQRQVCEESESPQQYRRSVLGELTERQRTVVESAYFSGFFEWPRETTGEELADTLGIAASTFHQHLRKSEQHIVAALLDETGVTE